MPKILDIIQQTHNKFLNMFALTVEDKTGRKHSYFIASRTDSIDKLKLKTRQNHSDGVIIYGILKNPGKEDLLMLIREYRCSIDDYIYELPAGLVDNGESYHEAAIREVKEETGMDFSPISTHEAYSRPFYMTIGLTDEACSTVYGYVKGTPSKEYMEASEDISTIFVTKKQAMEILEQENLSLNCAYLLMQFIHHDNPFAMVDDSNHENNI